MNRIIKFIFLLFLIIGLNNAIVFCEEINVSEESETPQKITIKADVKKEVTQVSTATQTAEIKELGIKYEKIKTSLEEIKLKISDINSSLNTMREDVKGLEEKNLEIKNLMDDLNTQKENLTNLEKKMSEIKNTVADYNKTKDFLKEQIDKMQSWDDILQVLKKEINNNELLIAQLKKIVNDLKAQYGTDDDLFNSIAKWPYLGITATLISVIAIFIAMSK